MGEPDAEHTAWVGRARPAMPGPPAGHLGEPTEATSPPADPHAASTIPGQRRPGRTPTRRLPQVSDRVGAGHPAGMYPAAKVRPPRRPRGVWRLLVTMLSLFTVCCAGIGIAALALSGAFTGRSLMGAAPPGPNTPVRDGSLTFVVTALTCGHASVGRSPVTRTAKGQYCLMTLTVENTGTETSGYADSFQKLVGSDGSVYGADLAASVIASEGISGLWNRVAPGDKVSTTVVYDVPAEARIAKAELHESFFSSGVTVFFTSAAAPG